MPAIIVKPSAGLTALGVGDEPCSLCEKTHGESAKLEETMDTKADGVLGEVMDDSSRDNAPQKSPRGSSSLTIALSLA